MLQQANDGGIDMLPVGDDVGEGWPGEAGAQLLLGHVAKGLVVAVEEPAEVRVEGLVGGHKLTENKGFKEPGGVGEVPLHRGRFGAGLHHQVLGGEWGDKRHGRGANLAKALEQASGVVERL